MVFFFKKGNISLLKTPEVYFSSNEKRNVKHLQYHFKLKNIYFSLQDRILSRKRLV
jgi:hypothetical protein